MAKRLTMALLVGGLMAPFPVAAQITNYWGVGVVRSGVTTGSSTTTSREVTNTLQQVYSGSVYTATGENVSASGALGLGTTYTITNNDGSPFQFSETYQPAGLVQITTTGRTVDATTVTNQLSVFSEVGGN